MHLESNPHFQARPLVGADVLVLAGDIGSYQPGSLLSELGVPDFGLARFSPRPVHEGGAAWPTPVIFVPGNHEYDGLDFDEASQRMRQACERWGLIWLEQQSVILQGVRFAGCTLWSDFDALGDDPDPQGAQAQAGALAALLKAREKAFRAANFYLRKHHALRGGQPMLAAELRELALQSQDWLRQTLKAPHAGPTVVVTHFAPSLLSADPRYGLAPGTAGFCNALDDLLPAARLWLHGHLHCPQDYWSQACRVVANPLGYARKGEQKGYQPELLISV